MFTKAHSQVLSYNEAEKEYRSDRKSSKEFCVTITEQRWACLAQSRDRDKEAIRLTEMPRSLFGNYTRLIQYAPLKVCHIVLIQVRCHKMQYFVHSYIGGGSVTHFNFTK